MEADMKKKIKIITGLLLILIMIAGSSAFIYGDEPVQEAEAGEEPENPGSPSDNL